MDEDKARESLNFEKRNPKWRFKMRIIFFGTPRFSAEVLKYLIEQKIDVAAVISKPDKPQGRSQTLQPTPVKLVAEQFTIPLYQPEKVSAEGFAETLKSFEADLFVVAAYGEILKTHVLEIPKIACINLHTSLLPKYRGAAPIQAAIIHGEQESGVTIIHMVKKMDAGNMIAQSKVAIGPEMTYGELENALIKLGSESLAPVIKEFERTLQNIPGTPQDESLVTLAPKIELEDCQVDWEKRAQDLHDLIRGVNPEPGAFCMVKILGQTKRLKLFSSQVYPDLQLPLRAHSFEPSRGLLVGTSSGALALLEVQLEGKKRMSAGDFFRGTPSLSFI
jgi:methionyl-tRNA formyltransferase